MVVVIGAVTGRIRRCRLLDWRRRSVLVRLGVHRNRSRKRCHHGRHLGRETCPEKQSGGGGVVDSATSESNVVGLSEVFATRR